MPSASVALAAAGGDQAGHRAQAERRLTADGDTEGDGTRADEAKAGTDLEPDGGADPGALGPTTDRLPAVVTGRRWKAARAGLSRRSSPVPTPAPFASLPRANARQRYRLALRASDQSLNLELMIRTAPLARCAVIAVVSPKGGPGKTTITALLGTLLAELRRDPVVALDANPDMGDLIDKLSSGGRGATAEIDNLTTWLSAHPTATPAQLWSRLGVGPHGLRWIATPRPPTATKERMIAAADYARYCELITRLRDYAGIILVDCGTGLLDPPVRAALEAADQILLITDSSATTARQVVAASGLLPDATPTWLVANRMPLKGSMLDLDQVVAAIPRLHGVTVVPTPPRGVPAESIVTPDFRWSEAPASWQLPIRELAARLATNWSARPTQGRELAGPFSNSQS